MENIDILSKISKEVTGSMGKRKCKRYTPEQKRAFVEESQKPGMSIAAVSRKYGVATSAIFNWRRLVQEGSLSAVSAGEEVVPVSVVKEKDKRIRELERMLGKKTMQCEILEEAVQIAREKKWI